MSIDRATLRDIDAHDAALRTYNEAFNTHAWLAPTEAFAGNPTEAHQHSRAAHDAYRAERSEKANPECPSRWMRCGHCEAYIADTTIDKGPQE